MNVTAKIIIVVALFSNFVLNAVTREAAEAFQALINVKRVILKDRRKKELSALGASLIHEAVKRASQVLGDQFTFSGAKVDSKIAPLLKETTRKIRAVAEDATFDFQDKIFQDNRRLATVRLSDLQKRQLLDVEFETLNERYTKVIQALKELGTRILPNEISMQSLEILAKDENNDNAS